MRLLAALRPYLPKPQLTTLPAIIVAMVACWCFAPAAAFAVNKPSMTFSSAHSSNYSVADRPNSHPIRYVVIHIMEGTYTGSISWFKNPDANVSAHYCISKTGSITQMVRDKDRAWHAGNALYNAEGIGIEHEGRGADAGAWTSAMLDKSAQLTAWICETYNIPVDKTHIKRHKDVRNTSCPGSHFDYDGYLQRVRDKMNNVPVPPPAANYDATLRSQDSPGQLVAGGEGVVTIELTNVGNTTWTRANTFLERVPDNVVSQFHAADNWVSGDTPTALDVPAEVAPGNVGTFAFIARVDAGANGLITEQFRLKDTRLDGGGTNFGPTITISIDVTPAGGGGGGALTITTNSLPNGLLDNPYNTVVNVSGGAAPYVASVGNGSLPAGLAMDANTRAISGTPVAVGSFSFDVTVRDANNFSVFKRFTITVERGVQDPDAGGGGCAAGANGPAITPVVLAMLLLLLAVGRQRRGMLLLMVAVGLAGLAIGCGSGVDIADLQVTITGVSPSGGTPQGGNTVIVAGDLFADGATVRFGDTEATSVTFIDSAHLEVVVPAVHPELGQPTVDVSVTNPDGATVTATAAYSYAAGISVIATSPVNGDQFAPTDGRITIEFSHDVHPLTLVPGNFLAPGYNVTVSQAGPATAQLQLSPAPTAGSTVTLTVTGDVRNSWDQGLVLCPCGCGNGVENPEHAGEEYQLTFTTSDAGTLADQTLESVGRLSDDGRGDVVDSEQTLALFDPASGNAEIVFLQNGRFSIPAGVVRFVDANPDLIEVEGAEDLSNRVRAGGTVTVTNAGVNRGTYRIAQVGDTRLVLADHERVIDESLAWGTLEFDDHNPQLMRAVVQSHGAVSRGVELDRFDGAPIVVEKLQTAVAASQTAAAILRVTERGTGQDVHAFVWRSGSGWTDAADSLLAQDHPGFGGLNRPLYPRLTMAGDVPVVGWVNGNGDAMVSRFENGAWATTRLYQNPAPGNVSTAAAVVAAHASTGSNGAVVIGVRNADQLQLLAHGWRNGTYSAAIDLLNGEMPAVPEDGTPVRTVSAGNGDILLLAVAASEPHRLRFRRYDGASNTFSGLGTAWSGTVGVDQIAGVATGEETAAAGEQVTHLNPSVDGAWIALTLADGSTRAVRYSQGGNSFGNGTSFGSTTFVWLHREINGTTHAFTLSAGADATVTHREATGAAWSAGQRVDSLAASIDTTRADIPVSRRVRFDNLQGIGTGSGELLLVEERAGARQVYTAHYRPGQGFGPAMPLGTDGVDHGLGALVVDLRGDGRFAWQEGSARTRLRVANREGLQPTEALGASTAVNVRVVADRRVTSTQPTGTWRQLVIVTRRDATGRHHLDAWLSE